MASKKWNVNSKTTRMKYICFIFSQSLTFFQNLNKLFLILLVSNNVYFSIKQKISMYIFFSLYKKLTPSIRYFNNVQFTVRIEDDILT